MKGSKNKKQSKILIELAMLNTELLFKDQCDIPHAKVKVGNHQEIVSIMSHKFESLITKLYFDYFHGEEIPTQESLNNAIRVLHAKTEFGDRERLYTSDQRGGQTGKFIMI